MLTFFHMRTTEWALTRAQNNDVQSQWLALIFINMRIWGGVGWDVNVPSHAHQNGDEHSSIDTCTG